MREKQDRSSVTWAKQEKQGEIFTGNGKLHNKKKSSKQGLVRKKRHSDKQTNFKTKTKRLKRDKKKGSHEGKTYSILYTWLSLRRRRALIRLIHLLVRLYNDFIGFSPFDVLLSGSITYSSRHLSHVSR